MTVTDVRTDPTARTLTITATFSAPPEQVWDLWADPRLLERWWGPPSYPATFVDHDLRPGGRVTYYMTGPEGDQPRGWWHVLSVDPPNVLEFEDGFADAEGNPVSSMPTTANRVTIEAGTDGSTRMTLVATFPTADAMEQLLAMGAREGILQAMEQMDGILAGATGE